MADGRGFCRPWLEPEQLREALGVLIRATACGVHAAHRGSSNTDPQTLVVKPRRPPPQHSRSAEEDATRAVRTAGLGRGAPAGPAGPGDSTSGMQWEECPPNVLVGVFTAAGLTTDQAADAPGPVGHRVDGQLAVG